MLFINNVFPELLQFVQELTQTTPMTTSPDIKLLDDRVIGAKATIPEEQALSTEKGLQVNELANLARKISNIESSLEKWTA